MSYRDEGEALRARIDVLENELADAKTQIKQLRGEGGAVPSGKNSFWLAAPSKLLLEQEHDIEPTPEVCDRLAALCRRDYPDGRVLSSDRAFSFRMNALMITLTPIAAGRSRLRLEVDHSIYAAMPALLAFLMVALAIAPVGATAGPMAVLLMLPIGWTLMFLFLRQMWGMRVNGYRRRLTKLFTAANASVEASAPAPAVRVAPYETSEMVPLDELGEEEEARAASRRA